MQQYQTKNLKQILNIESLSNAGFQLNLVANASELIEMANLLHVASVKSFSASLMIRKWRRAGLQIEGSFKSRITQNCVVSLEEFDVEMNDEIHQKFFGNTDTPKMTDSKEVEMLNTDNDPPEALRDGNINILEYLVEVLALQLDPYPRAPESDIETLSTFGNIEINQPDSESLAIEAELNPANKPSEKKPLATHKPFADLSKLLKDK